MVVILLLLGVAVTGLAGLCWRLHRATRRAQVMATDALARVASLDRAVAETMRRLADSGVSV